MSRPTRIQAALSAAGAALAAVVEPDDRFHGDELSEDLVEAANYTLRQRGLRIVDADPLDKVVEGERALPIEWIVEFASKDDPITLPARIYDGLRDAVSLVEAGGAAKLARKWRANEQDELRYEAVVEAGAWLAKQSRGPADDGKRRRADRLDSDSISGRVRRWIQSSGVGAFDVKVCAEATGEPRKRIANALNRLECGHELWRGKDAPGVYFVPGTPEGDRALAAWRAQGVKSQEAETSGETEAAVLSAEGAKAERRRALRVYAKRPCECTVGYCCNPCWVAAALREPCKTPECENPEGHTGEHGPCVNTQRDVITLDDLYQACGGRPS
jgi:hypothetical protein